jgi:protein ImuB
MFAVLHLADFSLQAILRARADLAGKPVALLRDERSDSPVLACNARARSAAVEPGLTGPQALARCASLALCQPDPAAETDAHAALLSVAFSLSPTVEATAPGIATLDLAGHAAGEREPRLRAALDQLAAHGLTATAGLASTPLLAHYAAQLADPFLAVENRRTFLAPLPLATASPPPELMPILTGWGLRTLGDLTDLSKADIAQRLGPAGLALWERAAGETIRPLRTVTPAPTFAAYYDSPYELETLEPVLFLLRRFVDRLALELANAGRAAASLALTLGCVDDTALSRRIRLPEPGASADVFFRALHTWLESLRAAAAIKTVHLEIEPVRALIRQHGLFDNTLVDAHGFAETLARAAAIAGSDRIGTPHLEDTHRPDAFALHPPALSLAPAEPSTPFTLRGLPLRRFRPPIPANVELQSGFPAYLWTSDLHASITAARGPYPVSGDWWETARAWSREEWDIEAADSGLYRLTHDLQASAWFIEGEYD